MAYRLKGANRGISSPLPISRQGPPLTVYHILAYLMKGFYLKQPLPIFAYPSSLFWMIEHKGRGGVVDFPNKVGPATTYLTLRCLNLTPLLPPQTRQKGMSTPYYRPAPPVSRALLLAKTALTCICSALTQMPHWGFIYLIFLSYFPTPPIVVLSKTSKINKFINKSLTSDLL